MQRRMKTGQPMWRMILLAGVSLFVCALCAPVPAHADEPLDPELERLKAAANEVQAALTLTERTFQKGDLDVVETQFHIDTGLRRYGLRYKTFSTENAGENPRQLNDWSSGYGMVAPHSCWYHQGMLKDVGLIGPEGSVYIMTTAGTPRVLADAGPRVGYDLVFTRPEGTIVVRTVALGGREELFIAIFGRLAEDTPETLRAEFYAFPQGFTAPFDRWVHGDGQDIQNAGDEQQRFPWDLDKEGPWMLFADHAKPLDEAHLGPLGLIYDKAAVTSASVYHNRNYAITATFDGPGTLQQRYIMFTFPAMGHEEAGRRLANVADADELFTRAFDGWPSPFAE